MTVTLTLDANQEQRLHKAAEALGLDDSSFLNEIFIKALNELAPPERQITERKFGLNALGVQWIADDFDAPLPDSFWLGSE